MKRTNIQQIDDLARSPAEFPDRPTRSGKRVVLIGANIKDDYLALAYISQRLAFFRGQLAKALNAKHYWDVYDMSTKPGKGDALDHLGEDVRLVVACHVPMCLITVTDKVTLRRLKKYKHQTAYFYNNRNAELLPWCMAHHVPLLAFGDQPSIEKGQKIRQTILFERPLTVVLYE